MKVAPRPGILLVAMRELRWMLRDRLAVFLVVGVPLISFALLTWTFSNVVIRDLNVSVVDADRTSTSLAYVQAIASAPGVRVAERPDNLTNAMHSVRSGKTIAAIYIAPDFEHDLIALKRPQIVVFYNRQYFTAGNNASSALSSAVAAATAALPPTSAKQTASFAPGPLIVEQYILTNPALNYIQFLLRSILPTILHIVTAIAASYAVGSEFSSRSPAAWMRAAGGSALAALTGKLLPLFAISALMMVVEAGIIHGVYQVPFRGNSIMMGAAACLMLIAYLSLGSFFQLLTRNLAVGLSLTAIICSPAFGFAGVGFPVIAMDGFARFWGALLPLRWYVEVLFDQAVRGLPTSDSALPFSVLAVMAVEFFALALFRLTVIARAGLVVRPYDRPVSNTPAPVLGMAAAMVAEGRRVLNDSGVRGLIILAPLLYGVLYPQPYLGQLLRDLPIAVVDQDNTEYSRDLIQTLDAHEAIQVAFRTNTLAEAQAALERRQVFAIVGIPKGTERDVLKGRTARLPAYVDSAYFLLYSRTLQGISEASGAASQSIAAHGGRLDGSLAHAAVAKNAPVELLTEPLFNPTGGYASYIVPAAFILILQQTLLMGAATLGGVAFEQGGRIGRRRRGGVSAVLGQTFAHLLLALPGAALYLLILPRVYGFSTLGHFIDLLLMVFPFILSVSFLAQFVGTWFKRRESAVLLFVATGLPLFFMVGVSWPLEAIPHALQAASRIFPSTSAIDGLVRINQMGATLHDVSYDWITLWTLTAVYAVLAILATTFVDRREAPSVRQIA